MFSRSTAVLASALTLLLVGCDSEPKGLDPEGPFLEVSPLSVTLDEGGDSRQLDATIAGKPASVTWISSDPATATVDNSGLVTSLAPGYSAVTATLVSDAKQTRTAGVTVNALQGTALVNGVGIVISDDGEPDNITLYRIRVNAGASNLTVTLSGGTGDADIYVRRGAPATLDTDDDDGWSFNSGNEESVSIDNPAAGTWYVAVALFDPYAGATLTATVTP